MRELQKKFMKMPTMKKTCRNFKLFYSKTHLPVHLIFYELSEEAPYKWDHTMHFCIMSDCNLFLMCINITTVILWASMHTSMKTAMGYIARSKIINCVTAFDFEF